MIMSTKFILKLPFGYNYRLPHLDRFCAGQSQMPIFKRVTRGSGQADGVEPNGTRLARNKRLVVRGGDRKNVVVRPEQVRVAMKS